MRSCYLRYAGSIPALGAIWYNFGGYTRYVCYMKQRKTIQAECKKHGLTEHVQERSGYFRCKRCRNDHVIKYRIDVKTQLISEFGGKCLICGYNKCNDNMVFHHNDPIKKDFARSASGTTLSLVKLRKEAAKCALLCCRCHGEVHAGIISIPQISS